MTTEVACLTDGTIVILSHDLGRRYEMTPEVAAVAMAECLAAARDKRGSVMIRISESVAVRFDGAPEDAAQLAEGLRQAIAYSAALPGSIHTPSRQN